MHVSIWGLVVVILVIVLLWRICGRAGFSPALSLLAVIPHEYRRL